MRRLAAAALALLCLAACGGEDSSQPSHPTLVGDGWEQFTMDELTVEPGELCAEPDARGLYRTTQDGLEFLTCRDGRWTP